MWARLLVILFAALCLSAHGDSLLTEGIPYPEGDDLYTQIHGDGVYSTAQEKEATRKQEMLRKDWEAGRLDKMARDTDRALDGLMGIAIRNLRRHGYKAEALEMEKGWKEHRGSVERIYLSRDRKIGDFAPLSNWLAVAYFILEEKLGYDICRALRLSDIHTLNFTIPVVFSPCPHGLVEFTAHFVHDDPAIFHPYRGLAPVVSYWVSVITCSVATYGAGYFFICSPIGMLVELGVDRWVAPALAPKIYGWACSE